MPPPLKNAALLSLPVLEGALERSIWKGVAPAVPLLEDAKEVVVTLVVFLPPLLSSVGLWYPKMDQ